MQGTTLTGSPGNCMRRGCLLVCGPLTPPGLCLGAAAEGQTGGRGEGKRDGGRRGGKEGEGELHSKAR